MSETHDAAFYERLAAATLASINPKNVGETYLGDFTNYAGIQLAWYGTELCLLFIV
jgi:hypothetical protein